MALHKELTQAKDDVAKAKAASRQLENLEKDIRDTELKAEAIYRQVPEYEELPLSLVKGLVTVVAKAGLREVKYDVTQTPLKKDANSGASQVTQSPEDAALAQKEMKKSAVTMSCRATFPQLIGFLDGLAKFERITAVEEITVERDEKLLPYQKVSLKLATFSFVRR